MTTENNNEESLFKIDELFFSRTDTRGVIVSGNTIFQRVSEYEWKDIINKPHNFIRHPDMPRGVFYLLWDNLKKGNPVAAYVKNLSKTGKYYWVYALVLPVDNYFLSIRLKPTSTTFLIIKNEYAKVLNLEKNQKINPIDSCHTIIETLKNIGFENYNNFMADALIRELISRRSEMNLSPLANLNSLDSMVSITNEIEKFSNEIGNAFKKSTYVPLNLEIQTTQIGEEGATIGVVATKYKEMSNEAEAKIFEFQATCSKVRGKVRQCQFFLASRELINEVIVFFKNEKNLGPINSEEELHLLAKLKKQYTDSTKKEIQSLREEFSIYLDSCKHLKTLSLGLEIVRITGRMETARVSKQKQLNDLIKQLTDFVNFLNTTLDNLELSGRALENALSGLNEF